MAASVNSMHFGVRMGKPENYQKISCCKKNSGVIDYYLSLRTASCRNTGEDVKKEVDMN